MLDEVILDTVGRLTQKEIICKAERLFGMEMGCEGIWLRLF